MVKIGEGLLALNLDNLLKHLVEEGRIEEEEAAEILRRCTLRDVCDCCDKTYKEHK